MDVNELCKGLCLYCAYYKLFWSNKNVFDSFTIKSVTLIRSTLLSAYVSILLNNTFTLRYLCTYVQHRIIIIITKMI